MSSQTGCCWWFCPEDSAGKKGSSWQSPTVCNLKAKGTGIHPSFDEDLCWPYSPFNLASKRWGVEQICINVSRGLSGKCSNPMHLLCIHKKAQIWVTECILIKGFKQSLHCSVRPSNYVRMSSHLLEHINFDRCQARVGDIEWGQ